MSEDGSQPLHQCSPVLLPPALTQCWKLCETSVLLTQRLSICYTVHSLTEMLTQCAVCQYVSTVCHFVFWCWAVKSQLNWELILGVVLLTVPCDLLYSCCSCSLFLMWLREVLYVFVMSVGVSSVRSQCAGGQPAAHRDGRPRDATTCVHHGCNQQTRYQSSFSQTWTSQYQKARFIRMREQISILCYFTLAFICSFTQVAY